MLWADQQIDLKKQQYHENALKRLDDIRAYLECKGRTAIEREREQQKEEVSA